MFDSNALSRFFSKRFNTWKKKKERKTSDFPLPHLHTYSSKSRLSHNHRTSSVVCNCHKSCDKRTRIVHCTVVRLESCSVVFLFIVKEIYFISVLFSIDAKKKKERKEEITFTIIFFCDFVTKHSKCRSHPSSPFFLSLSTRSLADVVSLFITSTILG